MGDGLGQVSLEMLANATAEFCRALRALDHKAGPGRVRDPFLQELGEREFEARDRIPQLQPCRRKDLVETLAEHHTHCGRQLTNALEMIVESALGDVCCLDDCIHSERLGRSLGQQHGTGFNNERSRLRPLLAPDLRPAGQINLRHSPSLLSKHFVLTV